MASRRRAATPLAHEPSARLAAASGVVAGSRVSEGDSLFISRRPKGWMFPSRSPSRGVVLFRNVPGDNIANMVLPIDINPELERRLRDAAARQGVDPRDYVLTALRERLGAVADGAISEAAITEQAPCLSAEESRLLGEINEGLSQEEWQRYYDLVAKRRAEQITAEELAELVAASDRIEQLNVRRIERLVELARVRNTTLPLLMEQLKITAPSVI